MKIKITELHDNFPELDLSGFAVSYDINPSLFRAWCSGIKKPSKKSLAKINEALNDFGKKLKKIKLRSK